MTIRMKFIMIQSCALWSLFALSRLPISFNFLPSLKEIIGYEGWPRGRGRTVSKTIYQRR